jgi:uncharacterized membrane protein YcaP (DUF421 family)
MEPDKIKLGDWQRILIGEVPASFFIELIIRAAVIYLILILSMRIMGKRMSSQLSRNELATLVSLAAAVGVPLMAPDRGILPAVVIAFVLVGGERAVSAWAAKNPRFEKNLQGKGATLVSNGVIDVDRLGQVGLSREQLFAQLRSAGILQLGGVKRVYMEANGAFTLVRNEQPVPGLSLVPAVDQALESKMTAQKDQLICSYCGEPAPGLVAEETGCPICHKKQWQSAVTEE